MSQTVLLAVGVFGGWKGRWQQCADLCDWLLVCLVARRADSSNVLTCVFGCWCLVAGRTNSSSVPTCVIGCWCLVAGRTDSSSVPTCVIGCWCVRWQEGQIAAVCRTV